MDKEIYGDTIVWKKWGREHVMTPENISININFLLLT